MRSATRSSLRGPGGQTLVELLMAVTLLSIVGAIGLDVIIDTMQESRFNDTRARLLAIRRAMVGDPAQTEAGARSSFGYLGEVGALPDAGQGLAALWARPAGVAAYAMNAAARIGLGWNGPYLNALDSGVDYSRDGWGNAFAYDPAASPPTVKSYGADGAAGGTGLNQDITMELPVNVVTATVHGVILDSHAPWSGDAEIELGAPDGSGGLTALTTAIAAADNGAFRITGVPIGIRSVTVYVPNKAAPVRTKGPVVFSITGSQYMIPSQMIDLSL